MPERKCEICGATDTGQGEEIWSWTGKDGKFRCRCRKHVPRSRLRLVPPLLPKTPQ